MDNQLGVAEIESVSMIGSSRIIDLPNVPEILEVGSDSTSLSPLTSSLDHTLTLEEDNLLSTEVDMGIEDTWTEIHSSSPEFVIPLPPPPRLNDFADVGADGISTSPGIEHGPFLRPSTPALNNLFVEASDAQDDTPIVPSSPGVCGLRNLGNTCFMAAGLQCLVATPPLMRHFLELEQDGKTRSPSDSLMAHFSKLLGKMWSGKYSVLRPTEFKQTLGACHSQFKDYRQHDCQEFLALLLDSLHEQMNTAKPAKGRHSSTSVSNGGDTHDNEIIIYSNDPNRNLDFHNSYGCCALTIVCPGSPNVTMAGSPRDLHSPLGELESTANSSVCSLANEAEEEREESDAEDSPDIFQEISNAFVYDKADGEQSEEKKELSRQSLELNTPMKPSESSPRYQGLYDIHKEAKTSNANFLVTPQKCNNEIQYDSQKFPKEINRKVPFENSNLTENHDFDNKSVSYKRIKELNVEKAAYGVSLVSSGSDSEYDSALEMCNVKRMRLNDKEKNNERKVLVEFAPTRFLHDLDGNALPVRQEPGADKHWADHLISNRSVIVDTFQGQFKSKVVCTVCEHVSLTYEPFMYLSVPLPHAMERQLTVTYVPANGDRPIKCVVSLKKQSRVGKLKEELLKTLEKDTVPTANIALAEVLENHIAKILDDNTLLKYVNDTNRSVYAFELTDPPDAYSSASESGGEQSSEGEACQSSALSGQDIPCMICLEELDGEFKRHSGSSCNLIICDPCIENYFKNQTEPQTCPMCSVYLNASSFTKVVQTGRPRPAVRILNVPLVLRRDTANETTNNCKGTKLFGYPHLVKLPSRVNAKDLYEIVRRNVPQEERYTVHFVDGQGHRCSRCIYTAHCTGCDVPESGIVALQNGDTLAVHFLDQRVPTISKPLDHISVSKQRPLKPSSLYDCLQAFSQSEILDEYNPWFCPECKRNQCATKTLTVHRYPRFLIIYLKRFVFYECTSMKLDDKVTFPLVDLNVDKHHYDLYACVCHFGGMSAGHYTAYAKNPRTDVWYYYNDEATSRQKPQEEDFSNAYILFYSRRETNFKPCEIEETVYFN